MSNLFRAAEETNENYTILFKKLVGKESSGTCIALYWNVRSVLNERKLLNLLQVLDDQHITFACLCETWFDSKSGTFSNTIKEYGFEIHHAYRENKKGGGVAILYRLDGLVKEGDASTSKYLSFEFSYVILTLQSRQKLVLCCIYRKQEVSFSTFLDEFASFNEVIDSKGDVMLIVGDFNVWVDVEENAEANQLISLMSTYGLNQIVEEPTQEKGHTLDQVYVNECQLEVNHRVINDTMGLITDHLPIILDIPTASKKESTQMVYYRKLKEVEMDQFVLDVADSCAAIYENCDGNFHSQYTKYDDMMRQVVDKHAPVVCKKISQKKPVWMDQEYCKCRALRRRYERLWKKNRTDVNRDNYVKQKNHCIELAVTKQKIYYTKLIEENGKCQKSLFKMANELLDKNSKKVLPSHEDSKQLANDFNQFYVDKVLKIRNSIPPVKSTLADYARPFKGEMLTELRPTTVDELRDIIKKSGIKTSMEDPMPSKLMVPALESMLPVLTKLINLSLKEGNLDGVKWSVIVPLLKKAGLDIDIWKNYRPVNNLVYFSKLIERVVDARLDEHMQKYKLHENTAYAYKRYHSTETMMIGIFDEVLQGFDQNKATIIIFIDLSAAFDTIDIDKILEILHDEIGIDGTALEWFRSYLSGRTQRVKINGEYSDSLGVPCGAPQGSVLGPKVFNINVRSQPLVFKHCEFKTSSFADDSNGRKQFALTFQYHILANDIPNCMEHIVDWSNAHFMKINPDKTELLLLRPHSLNKEVLINGVFIDGQCIRFSKQVKNVGVVLDENLTLDSHVNSVVSHSYKILKDIGRVKKYFTKAHLEKLVYAVISSRLDYCNSLYVNNGKGNLNKLQKLQNSAAKLILSRRRRDSAAEALRELHWLNVETRITFKILPRAVTWWICILSYLAEMKFLKNFQFR